MSYAKAAELLDLALEIAGRHLGMTYAEMDARSSAPTAEARRRNTQRQVKVLQGLFGPHVVTEVDERGKYVKLGGDRLRGLVDIKPQELAAVDRSVEVLTASNAVLEAESMVALRTKLSALRQPRSRRSADVDYEALLQSSHVLVRPGPRPALDPAQMRPLAEALLAIRQVAFDYPGTDGTVKRRQVHPLGIIAGHRSYLVARQHNAGGSEPALWRVDRMANVAMLDEPASRPEDFDLARFARRSFGVFHSEREYDRVEWRFRPEVADRVLGFQFHPDQMVTSEDDGSVTVRFAASGLLEMAWALYPWGDSVEVIAPPALKQLVAGHQRRDFMGVP